MEHPATRISDVILQYLDMTYLFSEQKGCRSWKQITLLVMVDHTYAMRSLERARRLPRFTLTRLLDYLACTLLGCPMSIRVRGRREQRRPAARSFLTTANSFLPLLPMW